MSELTRPLGRVTTSGMSGRWSRRVLQPVRAFRAYRCRRQTLAVLGTLDDRMLMDIGLHRSEIQSIALGAGHDPTRHHR
jgi:uncharacterized protein YjiS (DUF1127 family)